jgi:hypothetical protein
MVLNDGWSILNNSLLSTLLSNNPTKDAPQVATKTSANDKQQMTVM